MSSTWAPARVFVRHRGGPMVAVCAGLLSGAVGAYSYYDPLLRSVAHALGLWLVVAVAVVARRSPRDAMGNATVALVGAVVAFYVGKKVVYALRYPGMPYPLDYPEIGLWVVLAVAAGLGLALLAWLTPPPRRPRLLRAAWLTVPATIGGLLLVSAPDLVEQIVLVGS